MCLYRREELHYRYVYHVTFFHLVVPIVLSKVQDTVGVEESVLAGDVGSFEDGKALPVCVDDLLTVNLYQKRDVLS